MSLAALRKQLTAALDGARVRYALRFPNQKSGVLVIDLDPAPANLVRARGALTKWPAFVAWLATDSPAPQHATPTVLMTTQLAPAPAAAPEHDEAALLAAIAEAPDDDAPRLVYADLLAARGDPRGELIVLQCRQAAGDPGDKLRERIDAMLRAGWKAYAGELAPYAHQAAFRRGFVYEVRMTVAAFAKHGARVFGELPTHTLAIANDRLTAADVAKLVKVPALARVRGLHIAQRYDAGARVPLAALADAPLPRLEHLELSGCGHSPGDWANLFAHLQAPALAKIELARNHTSASIQSAIATNPTLARLRHFHEDVRGTLDTKPLTREAYELLAAHRALEALVVEGNELVDDAALAPFFSAESPAALRVVLLSMTGATNELLRVIARSQKAQHLEVFELHDAGAVTIDGARALLPAATRLRNFSLTSYAWTPEAVAAYEQLLLALPADRAFHATLPGDADASPAFDRRFRSPRRSGG